MANAATPTFRGIVSARDCSHHGHMVMSGWAGAVSDALAGMLATAGIDQSAGSSDPALSEFEQRVQVLRPIAVGESIEIMSGITSVDAQQFTVAHLISSSSIIPSVPAARAWSIVAPASIDGVPSQLSPDLIEVVRRHCISERELFGE